MREDFTPLRINCFSMAASIYRQDFIKIKRVSRFDYRQSEIATFYKSESRSLSCSFFYLILKQFVPTFFALSNKLNNIKKLLNFEQLLYFQSFKIITSSYLGECKTLIFLPAYFVNKVFLQYVVGLPVSFLFIIF